jgi:GT2 family glycosyltransferase
MGANPCDVTVIVCTRNRPRELERCLASLAGLAVPPREIIVVNSAGDTYARETATHRGTRYLETSVPGVSHARNVGIAAAQSEFIAYLDDDAVADLDWLTALIAPFADAMVAAVFGSVASLGEPGPAGKRYQEIAFRKPRLASLERTTRDWFWLANTGHIAIGANMAFRRSAIERAGGFDTRLGRGSIIPGAEEHRICSQLIGEGYRCVCSLDAIVRHPSLGDDEQLRQFEIQMCEVAAGYLTLIFLEHPAHRRELLRNALHRLFRRQTHAARDERTSPPSAPWIARLAAILRGLRLCWQARAGAWTSMP